MAYDFNSRRTRRDALCESIVSRIDAGIEAEQEKPRDYLGASQIGDECARRIQYELMRAPAAPLSGRIRRIFARGTRLEEDVAQWLRLGGWRVVTERGGKQIGFAVANGRLRGHVDGAVLEGPEIEGAEYPCIWENKVLGAKGWKSVAKDGVAKAYPKYADQIALYQVYLDITAPALFTAVNADTMEIWAELVPFDAARAQAASDRAVHILQATDAGDLLPRVGADPDAFPCGWCRFKAHCWERA